MRTLIGVAQRNVFVVLVLCAGGALQAVMSRGAVIADAWYTLLGGQIVTHSGLPHHETLTLFARGRNWVDQQWLGHLVFYGLWNAGGWPLATLSVIALYVGALALAAASARFLGASERSVSLLALACFVTGLPNTVLRAQILAYPLFSLTLLLLLADGRRNSRRVYVVFPILVLWANLHGSAVLGAALVALYGVTFAVANVRAGAHAGSWPARAALLVAAPWACVLASPYGLDLPGYYHRTLGNSSFGHIVSEWSASSIHNQPFFFVLLLVGLWLTFGHGRALGSFARLAVFLSGVGGLLAVRNVVWFALVAAAVLPKALDSAWPPRNAPRRPRLNLVLAMAGVAGFAIVAAASAAHGRRWFEQDFPTRGGDVVASAVARDPNLTVFSSERFADWLLFEHPELRGRIAYDIRFEQYSSAQLQSVYDFLYQQGADWRRAARGYRLLVLDAGDRPLVASYRRQAGVRTLYKDSHLAVLELPPAAAR